MNLEQADRLLGVWKTRLSAVAENLLDLQCDATYQLLTGSGGLSKVTTTGETASRLEPALRAMHPLFAHFGTLQSTMEKAVELRAGLPALFGAESRLRELAHLLGGRCLEAEVTDIPLAERELLSGSRTLQWLSAEELLDRMNRTFVLVRDAVLEAGLCWERAAHRLAVAEQKLAALRRQSEVSDPKLQSVFDRLLVQLDGAKSLAATDPFGAELVLQGSLEREISALRQELASAESVIEDLDLAETQMLELNRVHAEALDVTRGAMDALPASAGPVAQTEIEGLRAWLQRLQERQHSASAAALTVGLRNWHAAAHRCLAQDRKALRGAASLRSRKGQLRGQSLGDAAPSMRKKVSVQPAYSAEQLSQERP